MELKFSRLQRKHENCCANNYTYSPLGVKTTATKYPKITAAEIPTADASIPPEKVPSRPLV